MTTPASPETDGSLDGCYRRDILRTAGALGGLLGLGALTSQRGAADDEDWSLVVLPDTQHYAEIAENLQFARDQTAFVADEADDRNIRFVSHVGDIVNNGASETQWERMDDVMSRLDGVVPYATTVGNHDYRYTSNRGSGTENYSDYFGRQRFAGRSWYGGTGPNDRAHYQRFSGGGYDFLHLDLEWGVPGDVDDSDTVMGWADDVLSRNEDTPTIITTHAYIWDEPGREGHSPEDDGANSGRDIYQQLVRHHPQVFMVLNGHYHESDGEYHQVSQNTAGSDVYEVLQDYQEYRNGGDGWLRLVQFQPGGGSGDQDRIRVRTYSPSRDEYKTGGDSQFSFDLDFAERFDGESDGGSAAEGSADGTVTFRQGRSGYDGTGDTYLQEADPDADNADAETLVVDTSDPHGSGNDVHGLLRFDGIVGSGDDQVPSDVTVDEATLRVRTVNRGSGAAFHRMVADWDERDSWADWDGGIQADGDEAQSSADARTGRTSTGTTSVDVTESVQAWVDGDANRGWALLPLGGDGWDFQSAEGAAAPELTVQYSE